MKVSVSITTYNHEKYIAQAIDSVLMQRANFDYEILIGEDDSSDGTREVVKGYQEKYPERIRLFLNDRKNVIYIDGRPTGRWNFSNNLNHATGQYIALLDGDDYWTDPLKLQKQVDFLDIHPECAICFHNVSVCYEDGSHRPHNFRPPDQKIISTLDDLLEANFMPTCSVLFRNGLFGKLPDWFYQTPIGDWALHILNAQHGAIGYISEVMGVYRIHAGGLWSGQNQIQRSENKILFWDKVKNYISHEYERTIRGNISKLCFEAALVSEQSGDWAKAKMFLVRCVIEQPFNERLSRQGVMKMFSRLYAPRLHKLIYALRGYLRDIHVLSRPK